MPSWNELLAELEGLSDPKKGPWLQSQLSTTLQKVSSLRDDRNVILYASAFLQKPNVPAQNLQLTHEEINGFMSVMFGMEWGKGLTLMLHTPGGVTNATETIVDYLWTKFDFIEAIVPTLAMSAWNHGLSCHQPDSHVQAEPTRSDRPPDAGGGASHLSASGRRSV